MNAVQRVVVRVDASIEMGMGHLVRCLSLARALADNGASVCFLLRGHAAGLARLIEDGGHSVRLLADPDRRPDAPAADGTAHAHWLPTSWQRDAEQTLEAIDRIGPIDWLIVDHYALDARWERIQRKGAPRILAIDDLADRDHDCDILLDQNLVLNMERRYRGRLPQTCRSLLGPSFALLRPEFAEQRKALMERSGRVGRILVCYGGSDPGNETAKALSAIKSLSLPWLAVDAAIGLSNPHTESISAVCREMPLSELHHGADNMAELMARADLAIGAGGVMSWERCCLGLPTIAVHIADNQIGALTALASSGAVAYLGSAFSVAADQMAETIRSMLDDPARVRAMGEAARALVDGLGTSRVLEAMRSLDSI
ncbi:UDP-2,4-diacetamido-2,4,6-trideoxy-beta-L-altropyranose hydrolase [Bradyrhizobium sp. 157]|uniref:UDP-2,4-diacetamido-2,4, 6-trideoxy-beta-L-altropyranose hydrolase n=1 Tax=Bradyrhizobium sp. 157 TaxID=2782631 RepID=UPI001FFACD9A|nr:UDP-2,4-diacetamido-2,4,6-trideoxy-beta-L-altropyranose hydrolase [Bradyrhizobium sp. 157]MCK1640773.1 UDP-2,4-diacetamido-2,4,6-trideoxy-beta-L-altropyranose hydrolase [Bradyrhizobium sp. 157]